MNDEEKELSFENLSDIDLSSSSQSKQQGPKAEEPDIGKHNPQAPEKKKRKRKQEVKISSKADAGGGYYHCYLERRGKKGSSCPGTKIKTKEIWRHIRRKIHMGRNWGKQFGIPQGMMKCTGNGCRHCRGLPV